MGHDITGQNKAGEMIANLRFTMSDINSYEIYELLESIDFHGGVSGVAACANFKQSQIEKALKNYNTDRIRYPGNEAFEISQQNEVLKFLINCLETTKEEETVQVCFA